MAEPGPEPGEVATLDSVTLAILVLNGFLVFCMQAGFVVFEVGHGRAKNVRNATIKNFLSVLLSALAWWACGWAFAYGDSAGGIIGRNQFFSNGDDYTNPKPWFFTWTFALSCSTIVSGCLAERTQMATYPVVTVLISLLVHPIAAHWTWNWQSWLQQDVCTCNFIDFAGGVAVHGVGGVFGLIGAWICGPRIGRFDEDGTVREIPGHDMSLISTGCFLMWTGWFGFTGGTLFLYPQPTGSAINRVVMNVVLAAASGGVTAVMLRDLRKGVLELRTICNGLLSGLVTATAVAGYVLPWAACLAGALAGALYCGTSHLLLMLRIDDPLESSAVHLGSGVLGTLLLGLLARPEYVSFLSHTPCGGAFYAGPDPGYQIGMQFLGVAVIMTMAVLFALPAFKLLAYFNLLRVDQVTELAGIDNMEHGGPAYPEFMSAHISSNGHSC